MSLSEHLKSERGAAAQLSRVVGISQPFLWQCVAGVRKLPADRCPDIERATGVLCEQLRPDVRWQRVPDPAWPHPDGRPCIDVARPVEVSHAA